MGDRAGPKLLSRSPIVPSVLKRGLWVLGFPWKAAVLSISAMITMSYWMNAMLIMIIVIDFAEAIS